MYWRAGEYTRAELDKRQGTGVASYRILTHRGPESTMNMEVGAVEETVELE